jgi:multimeric flavodoxin WrbA
MKALILNGSTTEKGTVNTVSDYLVDYLKTNKHETDVMVLRNEKIAACTSCFGCWLKTPGECVIDDSGRAFARKAIQSDILLVSTPITFGMYSPESKKALDRIIPVVMPFFTKINGEIHHAKRYDKYPAFVAIGVLPSPDEESEKTFSTLVARNGINFHTSAISGIVYSTDKPEMIKEKIISTMLKAGVQ